MHLDFLILREWFISNSPFHKCLLAHFDSFLLARDLTKVSLKIIPLILRQALTIYRILFPTLRVRYPTPSLPQILLKINTGAKRALFSVSPYKNNARQGTENPCVGGSTPSRATLNMPLASQPGAFLFIHAFPLVNISSL